MSLRSTLGPSLVGIGCLLVACGGPGDGDVSGVLALEGDAAVGEPSFSTCALPTCHGADGNVGEGPALRDAVSEWTDEELARIIKFGIGDMGPSTKLSDQEVADLMAYLRQQFP